MMFNIVKDIHTRLLRHILHHFPQQPRLLQQNQHHLTHLHAAEALPQSGLSRESIASFPAGEAVSFLPDSIFLLLLIKSTHPCSTQTILANVYKI